MTSTILHCQTPITREMETPECRNTRQAKLLRERDEVNVPPESVITTSLVVSKSSEDPVVQWIDFRNARDTDILFRGRSVRLFERRSPGHLIFGGRLSRVRAVMALLTGEATIEEEVKKLSDPFLATIPLLCNTLLSGIEPTTAYRYATKEAYSGFNTPRGFSDTEAFVKLASEKLLEFLLQSPRLCFGSQRQKLLSYRKTEIPVITTTDGCEPSPSNTKLPNKITLKLPPKIDRKSTLDSIPQKRKREQSDGNNNDIQLQNLTAVKKKTATSVATSSTQAITSSTSSQVTSTVGLQDLPSDVFETVSKVVEMSKRIQKLVEENEGLNKEKREMQNKHREEIKKMEQQLEKEMKKNEELSKSNERMATFFDKFKEAMDVANQFVTK